MDDISVRIDGSTIRIDAHARFAVARSRRHIAFTNLRLCFPELSEAARVVLARRHFHAYGRSVLERGILWWASERRLRRLIRIEPGLPLDAIHAGPTILLCPHFVGLDVAGVAIALDCSACAIYSRQSNEGFDRALHRGRTRFKPVKIFPQGAGVKPVLRATREVLHFFMLPDFKGWSVKFHAPWVNDPGQDMAAAAARMNRFIESEIRKAPAEYFWVHRRFKTRPAGEPGVYGAACEQRPAVGAASAAAQTPPLVLH